VSESGLSPQQRAALERATDAPKELSGYELEQLGAALASGDAETRADVASAVGQVIRKAGRMSGSDPSFEPMVEPLTELLADEWTVRKRASEALLRLAKVAPRTAAAAVPDLTGVIEDDRGAVVKNCIAAIAVIGEENSAAVDKAIEPLIELLAVEGGDVRARSRAAAATALGRLAAAGSYDRVTVIRPQLVEALDAPEPRVRRAVVSALGQLGTRTAADAEWVLPHVLAALDDPEEGPRVAAVTAAGTLCNEQPDCVAEVLPPVRTALDDPAAVVRKAAAEQLGEIGLAAPDHLPTARDALIRSVSDGDAGVRTRASEALRDLVREEPSAIDPALDALIDRLDDDSREVREAALRTLNSTWSRNPDRGVEALDALLGTLDDDFRLRIKAVRAIKSIGAERPEEVAAAVAPLVSILDDENGAVAERAGEALVELATASPRLAEAVVDRLGTPLSRPDDDAGLRAGEVIALVAPDAPPDAVEPAIEPLRAFLDGDNEEARAVGAFAFGEIARCDAALLTDTSGDTTPVDAVAAALNDDSDFVRIAAARATLLASDDERRLDRARDLLCRTLGAADEEAAHLAVESVGIVAGTDADPLADARSEVRAGLTEALEHESWQVRREACRAVGALDLVGVLAGSLEERAETDENGLVRETAQEVLAERDDATAPVDAADSEMGDPTVSEPETFDTDGSARDERAVDDGDRDEAATAGNAPQEPVPDTSNIPTNGGSLTYAAIDPESVLGRGAADVHLARVRQADGTAVDIDRVVLKEPRLAGRLDDAVREEFLEEAHYWGLVDDHPHVVDVMAWGTDPHPWLAVEYVAGGSLAERDTGTIDLDEALWLGARVADALREAHTLGLRHLDLKPDNVLLQPVTDNPWDVPKVADWGLARFQIEHSGRMSQFTPGYAAPEQFLPDRFGSPDARTDLYQLGVVLYELATGRHPFPDRDSHVPREHLTVTPPPPSDLEPELPSALDDMLGQLLAPNPDDRYDSAAVVRNALDRLRTGDAVTPSSSVADRADLYASALEHARDRSLRECERWAGSLRSFVEHNPVAHDGYEPTAERVAWLVEERLPAARTARGDDHELVVGGKGGIDLAAADPELYHDLADVAERVRRCYLRAG
jgi:HEAT repeat protein